MDRNAKKSRLENQKIVTRKDPHHDGTNQWAWDGNNLWIKMDAPCVKTWNKVNKSHPTPKRVAMWSEMFAEWDSIYTG